MLDNKPPLTISDQLALLLQRGMSVPDPVTAKRFLTNVSYYRLKGTGGMTKRTKLTIDLKQVVILMS